MDFKLDHNAWVVVADGEKYLLLRNAGDRGRLSLEIFDHEEQDNPPTRDQGTDKPGRFDDAGVGRSAVQDTDWHQLEKERFADELADRLSKAALAQKFAAIVIVADPSTLGLLRDELHDQARQKIVAEIDKNLTNHDIFEIENILKSSSL